MKKTFMLFVFAGSILLYSCGGGETKPAEENNSSAQSATVDALKENPAYDLKRGEGKFKDIEIAEQLDPAMVTAGERVYNVKCSGCHKLTDEKLVGPGWKGVSKKHRPEWIMNFVTNTDEMIDKDPQVQAQLELCMVRMPNQNISDEAARGIYEFMRKNDGVK